MFCLSCAMGSAGSGSDMRDILEERGETKHLMPLHWIIFLLLAVRNMQCLQRFALSLIPTSIIVAGSNRRRMPHEFLHRHQVGAIVQQRAGKGAPEVVPS